MSKKQIFNSEFFLILTNTSKNTKALNARQAKKRNLNSIKKLAGVSKKISNTQRFISLTTNCVRYCFRPKCCKTGNKTILPGLSIVINLKYR